MKAVQVRKNVEAGGRVVVFEEFAPWKVSLFFLFSFFFLFWRVREKKKGRKEELKYIYSKDEIFNKNSVTRS